MAAGDFIILGAALLATLGDHRLASTAVYVRRLVDPSWKVEIDAVALVSEDL
jgi:hypothetical protein